MRARRCSVPVLALLATVLAGGVSDAAPRTGSGASVEDLAASLPGRGSGTGPVRLAMHRIVLADADSDGLVAVSEAGNYFAARFVGMDTNADAFLSEDEFVRGGFGRHGTGLQKVRAAGFDAFDLDGNGALGPEEFLLARASHPSASSSAREKARRAIFSDLDGDGNGRLDREAFLAAGAARYAAGDIDGDGQITIFEFLSGPAM